MQIFATLKKDHEKLKQALNELVSLEGDSPRRHQLVRRIRDELIPHARAEEAVFYNSLRSIPEANKEVMHGYTEHMEAETLLRTLQVADKIDAGWKRTARQLKKGIEHHIREEESEIFEIARKFITDQEASAMDKAFRQMKAEVKKQGFMKNTLDLVVNLMPARFHKPFRKSA